MEKYAAHRYSITKEIKKLKESAGRAFKRGAAFAEKSKEGKEFLISTHIKAGKCIKKRHRTLVEKNWKRNHDIMQHALCHSGRELQKANTYRIRAKILEKNCVL